MQRTIFKKANQMHTFNSYLILHDVSHSQNENEIVCNVSTYRDIINQKQK